MGHGYPDWGQSAPIATVYTVLDMAELAARLGAANTFDRRGNIVLLEDFQGSLAKCIYAATGAGGSVSISNAKARYGDFSCKLTTGNATDNEAYVGAYLAYPVLNKLGIEFSWCPGDYIRDIDLDMYVYDGAQYYDYYIRWHAATDKWQYKASSGNWVDLEPAVLYARESYTFNQTKLVVDLEAHEYVRLISNDRTWDLSDIGVWSDVSSNAPRLVFWISVYTRANYNHTTYLGNMIVTQNEP